ncbi:MAG: hypothetical protein V2J16_01240 [Thermoleophilia bacterium]|jgi:hypothetical protein|nr:hypothetical protein [Thermoleophilia bacterium]
MRKTVYIALCAALSVASLLVGACGGSESDSAGSAAGSTPGAATEMVEVAAFEGTTTATTEPFTLQGGAQHLEFQVDRGSAGRIHFAIVSTAGDQRVELFDSGVYAPSEGAELEGSSYTELGVGDYVIVAECEGGRSWSVTVREER